MLTFLIQVIFFLSFVALLHTYVVYPILIRLLARNKKRNTSLDYSLNDTNLPNVEVIFAAHNEQSVIYEKIQSTLNSSYDLNKLSITVGSDGSTDQTNGLIKAFGEKVKLRVFEGRNGKIKIINELVLESIADIIILTDANVFFQEDTIFQLIKVFNDERIGAAGGTILKHHKDDSGVAKQEMDYMDFENKLKSAESVLYQAPMGLEGGVLAIRRADFKVVPPNFIVDDFYHGMQLLTKGKHLVFLPEARVFEDAGDSAQIEFIRKRRIAAGNFQNVFCFKRILLDQFSGVGFAFLSHKVLRWFGPLFYIIGMLSVLFLAMNSFFFSIVFLAFCIVLVIPVLYKITQFAFLSYPSHFVKMNVALLLGFFDFVKGIKSNIWEPTKRI